MFMCAVNLLVPAWGISGITWFLLNGCLSYPTDAEKGGSLVVGDFEIAAKYGEWYCNCQGL